MALTVTNAKLANHVYVRGCFATKGRIIPWPDNAREFKEWVIFSFANLGSCECAGMFCELTVTSPDGSFIGGILEKWLVFLSAEMMKKNNPFKHMVVLVWSGVL